VYIMLLCSLYYTLDIDECVDGISGCSQVCSNTDGSFECSCMEGYSLGSDEKSCEGACICIYTHHSHTNTMQTHGFANIHACMPVMF